MAQEMLAIEMVLKEINELARSGQVPLIQEEVKERETVVGSLKDNPRLMALFLLYDMTVRAIHAARATCERRMAGQPWGGATWDGAREDFKLVRQLEAKRDLLHPLFYYELQTWLDEWEADRIAVRQGLEVVTYDKVRKTKEVLQQLLKDGSLED